MSENTFINIENNVLADIYFKRPIVITKGKGASLWDVNGREYIDCMGAYGVCIVGHCHPKVVAAIQHQAATLISCHNSLYNDARARFLQKLINATPAELTRVFLSNSGTEAIEAALKIARKHTGKPEIIAFMGGYHGKTFGSLSATWNKRYRTPFEPLVPNFKHVPFGRSERVEEAITQDTAAVLVEPIQGEGGVKIPPPTFLSDLQKMCNDYNVLLICDEVQTGFGRTGTLLASEQFNIVPDILCLAKAVGGGVPIGVTIAKENVMSSLKIGDHSSTFGGNPLASAAAEATLDVIIDEKLPERAVKLGSFFIERLQDLAQKYRIIREVRGMGLMIGMQFRFEVLNVILRLLDHGIIALDAGRNVLRFLPPLVISRDQIEQVLEVLDLVIAEEESARIRR
jgi:acetylornithine/LysW-gamma-L-lysine aminotransferase